MFMIGWLEYQISLQRAFRTMFEGEIPSGFGGFRLQARGEEDDWVSFHGTAVKAARSRLNGNWRDLDHDA
jgi:hypothetical protein